MPKIPSSDGILFLKGDEFERVIGIEPTSSAWKADIISHYTTPANVFPCLRGYTSVKAALVEAEAATKALM